MAAGRKRDTSISTTTATVEVSDADDETETGQRGRNPGSGIHGTDEIDSGRVGQGHGRAMQARQRALQQPQGRYRADCAHPCPCVRQQPRFLAERTAAQRLVGGDALAARARADKTRPPDRSGCMKSSPPTVYQNARALPWFEGPT